ncbi:MAG: tetratricopeptide repeat protein [Defluviitaleaceae bacterium]|nr:tetratricopeptide repeat protein [Defluviitaleaceae bacterium]MCL2836313.1 tetratricopeptide repeat protein [Defluviitaleaceae bacterium]
MEKSRKYRNLIVIAFLAVTYYAGTVVMGLSFPVMLLIYAAMITALCVIFKAGFFYWLANLNYSTGKKDKARQFFELSIRHGSKNPMTYLNYAVMLVQNNEAVEALKYAQKAMDMNPGIAADKNARLTVSSAYWLMGEIDKAVETLEELVEKYEYVNTHVLTSLGYLYILKGNLEKARLTSEKAIEDDPASAAAWDNLGQIFLREGDVEKAEETFLKAMSFKDNLVDSAYFLGQIYEDAGKTEQAREYFLRARGCKLSSLNTVTEAMVEEKYRKYLDMGFDENDGDEAD